jgi:multisubunit Na+/H+ antiporter MnhB subunit
MTLILMIVLVTIYKKRKIGTRWEKLRILLLIGAICFIVLWISIIYVGFFTEEQP